MRNKILKRCRICFSKKLALYLDLGNQPFSNSFLEHKDIKKEKKFPLKVVVCKNCGLSQLSIIPNTKFIFSKYDYLSSSSKALDASFSVMLNLWTCSAFIFKRLLLSSILTARSANPCS